MKAIRIEGFGGPDALRLVDVPVPSASPAQIVVRVEAAGVNFIDVYHRTGLYPNPLPLVPGMEGAGVVAAVGPGVSLFREGDRVAWANVLGSYAGHVLLAADRAVAVPPGLRADTAAAAMLQGMTAHYLCTSTYPLKKGDACLVHAAAGGVGLLLVQMAKRRGARVIGTVGTEAKAVLAREAGADEIILYAQEDFLGEVKRLTGGRGVDVVYDSVGSDRREEPRLPRRSRDDGLLRQRERARAADRPAGPLAQGLALPDAPEPRALHRRPGQPRGAGGGRARGRGGRPAEGAHRPDLPARGGGRGPPRPRGAADDRQGAARPLGRKHRRRRP